MLQVLRKDPSLRLTEPGRLLLRLLEICSLTPQQRDQLIDFVPEHCADMVSAVARECAEAWLAFADGLAAKQAESRRMDAV
jgi:hypothetical protein